VGSRSRRTEIGWWLGVAAWVAFAALWEPEPPLSYLEAPSASTRPDGFAVFHDLVARSAAGARRLLGRVSQLGDDVGVLVVLSPSRGIDERDREEMLEWASDTGGTLIIGHPVADEEGSAVERFGEEGFLELSARKDSGIAESALTYVPRQPEAARTVPPFTIDVAGEMELSEAGAVAILADGAGRALASVEAHGAGTVIQLADAALLDNSALGYKRAHLFAAALIDEAGPDAIWAFDEAHEGIEPEPSLIALLGSGPWRGVLLQALLLGLFLYWWASARLARPLPAPPPRKAREVTTLARDVGDFYLRAGRGDWALSRVLERLRRTVKERGLGVAERQAAEDAATEAARELERGSPNLDRHVYLIRKMAICQRVLAESSKGKKR
jgi:hypothetical protein